MKGYDLPGIHTGEEKSYLKWVKDSETTDFPEFSMCMRCLQSVRICKLLKTPPRFNPSRIDVIEMTLAAVMNGKGNGNKDEVGLKTFGEIFRSPSSLLVE